MLKASGALGTVCQPEACEWLRPQTGTGQRVTAATQRARAKAATYPEHPRHGFQKADEDLT